MDPALASRTLGAMLKHHEDHAKIQSIGLDVLIQ